MTKEQINRAVAESLGWRLFQINFSFRSWLTAFPPGEIPEVAEDAECYEVEWSMLGSPLPFEAALRDWHSSLDACVEFEKAIKKSFSKDQVDYCKQLCEVVDVNPNECVFLCPEVTFATAPQRCEAYLRTISKWVD